MPGTRSFTAGSYFFNLEGVKCGFLKSVDGGGISADVIEEKLGPDVFVKKHIGQPKYEDVTITFDFELGQNVYGWIAETWKLAYSRKDGSIVVTDAMLQAKSERQFLHALISEVTFPALDASSKDAAFFTLTFSPELIREVKAAGKLVMPKPALQKRFLAANFRLELDGLDCSKVNRIDSFTVAQEPGKVDFPNLRITLAEAADQTWVDWFDDFVIKGNNGDAAEKSGRIVFLGPDLKAELGRVELHNVGIFALRHPPAVAETVSRVVAELYCERMELLVGRRRPRRPHRRPRRRRSSDGRFRSRRSPGD